MIMTLWPNAGLSSTNPEVLQSPAPAWRFPVSLKSLIRLCLIRFGAELCRGTGLDAWSNGMKESGTAVIQGSSSVHDAFTSPSLFQRSLRMDAAVMVHWEIRLMLGVTSTCRTFLP